MMVESAPALVIRCPYCDTTFRPTESVLAAATQEVKCGYCLRVLVPARHLEFAGGSAPPPAPAEPEEPPALAPVPPENQIFDDGEQPEDTPLPFVVLGEEESLPETLDTDAIPQEVGELTRDRLTDHAMARLQRELQTQAQDHDPVAPRRRLLAPVFAAMALVLLLLAQVLWFYRGSLALDPRYRGYYIDLCEGLNPVIDCRLPEYVDLKAIRTRDLVVRTHPRVPRALIVDAVIVNDAPFAQPFPGLSLMFSDVASTTVASRRFKPSEYLAGEMTGMRDIPAGSEVRIAIEIVDPGAEAIGYELYAVALPAASS